MKKEHLWNGRILSKVKKIAIIPARGGSKRIPRKNIKDFLGKPIIAYSIEAAIASELFDEVMVSTDDDEIFKIAMQYGANVPFMRSKKNSDDYATTSQVLIEVLNMYHNSGYSFDFACCLYPTAPFITSEKLKNAFEKINESGAKSVLPIVKYSFPILRSFSLENGFIKMNWPKYLNTRSQDLKPAYHDAGQFYFLKVNDFLKENKLFTDVSVGLEMPESEVQDIDNYEDWKIAEVKYSIMLQNAK